MTILTNCVKLCHFTISRNVHFIAKSILWRSTPKLINVSNHAPANFREISQSPQELDTSINTDITQSLLGLKYLRLIKRAIRDFGPIVEENKRLEKLLSKANELGVPQSSIEYAQRVCLDVRTNLGLLELFMFSSCHLIVQYEDIDLQRTKPHINRLCEKYDAFMGERNVKWPQSFDQKGIISIKSPDESLLPKDSDEAQRTATRFGAQSVKHEVDLEGSTYLLFTCEPWDLQKVTKQLEHEGCEIEEAIVGYIPKKEISLPAPNRNIAYSVINELCKIQTIDNIYTNILLESK